MSTIVPVDWADVPVVATQESVNARARRRSAALVRNLLVFGALFCASVTVQIVVGAYGSERSSYTDEAAHFMNALLVRDYVREGLGQHPIEFASDYYLHYPKIAPGMWPPLFSTSLGLFMSVGVPPQIATFLLLALLNAWAAWRLHRFILSFESSMAAFTFGAMLCFIPGVVALTTASMIDLLILTLAIEATYWLARFFYTGQTRHALLFGVFSTLCCLSKGNGLALAFLPPCLALFTRRYDRFKAPGLYIAAAMVVLVAGPPMAVSFRLDAAIGDFGPLNLAHTLWRLQFYTTILWQQLGSVVIGFSLLGFVVAVYRGASADRPEASIHQAALAALVVGGVVFHLVNPHTVDSPRYIALLYPAMLGLVPIGIRAAVSFAGPERARGHLRTALCLATMLTFFAVTPSLAARRPLGAGTTVDFIERASGLPGSRLVVISDEYGEGAMVSEVARRHPMPRATVIRGSKLVAIDDWGGRDFRLLFDSPRALLEELEKLHVTYLVIDYSPAAIAACRFCHLLDDLVATYGDRLDRVFTTQEERLLVTYRLKYRSPGPPKAIEIPVLYSLGRILK